MCITHCIQYTEPLLKFLLGLLVSLGVPEYSHLLTRYCRPASLRALSTEFSLLLVRALLLVHLARNSVGSA
jgi:hypothetical protein